MTIVPGNHVPMMEQQQQQQQQQQPIFYPPSHQPQSHPFSFPFHQNPQLQQQQLDHLSYYPPAVYKEQQDGHEPYWNHEPPQDLLLEDTRKRHERPPSDNDDSSSSIPRFIHQNDEMRRRRRRSNVQDSPVSSSSGGSSFWQQNNSSSNSRQHHYHSSGRNNHVKKSKIRSDSSLLGKTAVAALFEWCSKRQYAPPTFVQEEDEDSFVCTVRLSKVGGREANNEEDSGGCGRGRTKAAARQDAARQTLQALLPGIVFDEATGILLELPCETTEATTTNSNIQVAVPRNRSASMEDDLPNLAKRLAIGRDDHKDSPEAQPCKNDVQTKRLKSSRLHQHHAPKRAIAGVYPASSTTTASEGGEEDDANAYYQSRGASLCTVLLHAMVQIDPRIQPPEYTFEIVQQQDLKRKVSETNNAKSRTNTATASIPAVRATRGPFVCRAKLVVRGDGSQAETKKDEMSSKVALKQTDESKVTTASEASSDTILQASATCGTKREARHVASAKLLALLFPECKTMVQVKAAAEAKREQYAEEKARKQKQQTSLQTALRRHREETQNGTIFAWALRQPDDPEIPPSIQKDLIGLIGMTSTLADDEVDGEQKDSNDTDLREAASCSPLPAASGATQPTSPEFVFRQLSRQKQLDFMTDQALLTLNERDEEGRTVAELTEDDVGRTLLRRAVPEDLCRIKKLFDKDTLTARKGKISQTTAEDYASPEFWSPSSIVLLLCRAISPFDDPPLGCAVVSLGFSMKHGRTLQIARIASEPHLPKERFVECLSDFANAMKCHLEIQRPTAEAVYTLQDARVIIESHVFASEGSPRTSGEHLTTSPLSGNNDDENEEDNGRQTVLATSLQAVQEESEGSDSSVEKRPAKQTSKPSKRSRFQ
jgi:hypothetical protein